jgi:hypothetical protein
MDTDYVLLIGGPLGVVKLKLHQLRMEDAVNLVDLLVPEVQFRKGRYVRDEKVPHIFWRKDD